MPGPDPTSTSARFYLLPPVGEDVHAAQPYSAQQSGNVTEGCGSIARVAGWQGSGGSRIRSPPPDKSAVQLANVTRDIEKDLDRGIAYHPALSPYRRAGGSREQRDEAIRAVREELLGRALHGVQAYGRLFEDPGVRRSPAARAAAVMLLSFTDLHFRSCMPRIGRKPWRGPGGPFSVVFRAWPALVSSRAARRSITRIERNFLAAAEGLGSGESVGRGRSVRARPELKP